LGHWHSSSRYRLDTDAWIESAVLVSLYHFSTTSAERAFSLLLAMRIARLSRAIAGHRRVHTSIMSVSGSA
jgi:hypothetical protein